MDNFDSDKVDAADDEAQELLNFLLDWRTGAGVPQLQPRLAAVPQTATPTGKGAPALFSSISAPNSHHNIDGSCALEKATPAKKQCLKVPAVKKSAAFKSSVSAPVAPPSKPSPHFQVPQAPSCCINNTNSSMDTGILLELLNQQDQHQPESRISGNENAHLVIHGSPLPSSTATSSRSNANSSGAMTAIKSKSPAIFISSAHRPENVIIWRVNVRLVTAGKILLHCINLIKSVIEKAMGLLVYKIGIAINCQERWSSPSMGYARDGQFSCMLVLHTGPMEQCGMLEASLIQYFLLFHPQGLQNINPGGEGISNACAKPVHVYVVYKALPLRPPG